MEYQVVLAQDVAEKSIYEFDCGYRALNDDLVDAHRGIKWYEYNSITHCLINPQNNDIIGYFTICDVLFFADYEFTQAVASLMDDLGYNKDGTTSQIYYFATDVKYQNLGYGTYMMAEAFIKTIENYPTVELIFIESLDSAKGFYSSLGLRKVYGDEKHYFATKEFMKLYIENLL
jgi:ribosomal protein S18 acetylase RimI-like enzyme